MKFPPLLLLFVVTGWYLTASVLLAADPVDSVSTLKKVSERYALTQSRINLLLAQRLRPPLAPNHLANPFEETNSTVPISPADAGAATTLATSAAYEAEMLARYAANLKISGGVLINDQPHLAINQILYKAGDMIPVGTKDQPLSLQILHITSDELTLGLNQAEQIISLKKPAPGK